MEAKKVNTYSEFQNLHYAGFICSNYCLILLNTVGILQGSKRYKTNCWICTAYLFLYSLLPPHFVASATLSSRGKHAQWFTTVPLWWLAPLKHDYVNNYKYFHCSLAVGHLPIYIRLKTNWWNGGGYFAMWTQETRVCTTDHVIMRQPLSPWHSYPIGLLHLYMYASYNIVTSCIHEYSNVHVLLHAERDKPNLREPAVLSLNIFVLVGIKCVLF